MLKPRAVVIPFAAQVATAFDDIRVDSRRHYAHLMHLTTAVTLLHQLQREEDADGRLIATAFDYQVAADLIAEPFEKAGGGVSRGATALLERLKARFDDREFNTRQVRENETASRGAIHGWLSELVDGGAVEQTEPGRGKVPAKWKLTGKEPSRSTLKAPSAADVFSEPPDPG